MVQVLADGEGMERGAPAVLAGTERATAGKGGGLRRRFGGPLGD